MNHLKVTARVNYVIERHRADGLFAARLPALGLTGYGETKEEALRSCRSLYGTFVQTYRSRNMFPSVLDRASVKWAYTG